MTTSEIDRLTRQNHRLKLSLTAICGMILLALASGQVSVPQNSHSDEYHVAVAVDNDEGFVILVRNDGKIVRVEKYGRPSVINP